MFTKNEIKQFIIALGRKWLFPDFNNKITWAMIYIAGAIILTPVALQQVIINWLIDTINLNNGNKFNLAEIAASSDDYILAFSLIFLALTHNVWVRFLQYKLLLLEERKTLKSNEIDKCTYQKFIEILPSNGISVDFLKSHDLANSFHDRNLDQIQNFISEWNVAENRFLDDDLEKMAAELYRKLLDFDQVLSHKAFQIGNGWALSIIPDRFRATEDWPDEIDSMIQDLNSKATECYEMHQKFVIKCRQKLKC